MIYEKNILIVSKNFTELELTLFIFKRTIKKLKIYVYIVNLSRKWYNIYVVTIWWKFNFVKQDSINSGVLYYIIMRMKSNEVR